MTGYRFMRQWKQGGVVFRYFCPKGLPRIRIRGEPGTPEFEANYQRAFAVTTREEMQALRAEWGMIAYARRKGYDYERGDAIMAWANHEMMTMRQIELVQRALGLSYEEVTRNLPGGFARALHQELVPPPVAGRSQGCEGRCRQM
jgi:hypothetical protein